MLNPISTYRIQFHKDFNFEKLQAIIAYLKKLGIGTLYASPIFNAVPGSMHGYDGLHPHQVNPEIGTLDQLSTLSKELRENNIGWLQDIVPNHMGFHPGNKWLMDVLENGEDSKYAKFFDIDWREKIMVPFLGASVDDAIKNELKISVVEGKPFIQYYDSYYPLKTNQNISENITGDAFKTLLDEQHYRLCSWTETDNKINYRRFFTINSLICLNIQDDEVFDTYHELIGQLVATGIFTGLRIDHIDGLYDPKKYLDQLRTLAGKDTHITIEKILQPGETLPSDWNIQGNTGYDFLSMVNNLFTRIDAKPAFTEFYQQLINDFRPIEFHVQDKKEYILQHHMQGELDNLYHLFKDSNLADKKYFASLRDEDLKEAIAEFLVQCPVYRYYGSKLPLNNEESSAIENILNKISSQNPDLREAVGLLKQVFIQNHEEAGGERNENAAHFFKRCMQFTGPLMAKGVEDTLMYTYNRFIGHNEVGDQPASFGIAIEQFHKLMTGRQKQWPYSLNATSTHDTKRGEDVRARLNVLTDIAELWFEKVNEWRELNKAIKGIVDDNDEYFIYQTLTGCSPFPGENDSDLESRLNEYFVKAFREAKTRTNWTEPCEKYESAVQGFVHSLLQKDASFRQCFTGFLQEIADHGIINSLSQLILKFTCPGVPDVYQGCETWDLSLVDPDNRRPVDYEKNKCFLDEASDFDSDQFEALWEERYSGKIKLWLTHQLFKLRKSQPELFTQGEYIALQTEGSYKENVIAFARRFRQHIYIIALPLHTAAICKEQHCEPVSIDWKDTSIILPFDADAEWEDIFTEAEAKYTGKVKIKNAFSKLPFLIWKGKLAMKERSAGILLHITSLPSEYGIGDMGPEAKAFADFLYRSRQKYWQLLPLNPTEAGQAHSPYSAVSAMAGNTLLISPDVLIEQGLLDKSEVIHHLASNRGKVNYKEVVALKEPLLNKSFWSYLKKDDRESFEKFCSNESHWLEDFTLFTLLKQVNNGKPWFEWEEPFKFHEEKAIAALYEEYPDEIYRIKWLQYIFDTQWNGLKQYCNERNILLIGDIPIYVSYDSADVWANREIFAIDDNGNATAVAGVPPDAFSADGQLWGMPVFKWDVLKERNYDWWLDRIRRNRKLFDLVRIDHFRAFAAYWEVPFGEHTAKTGVWKTGPGNDFFEVVQRELGELPFIAEDLGDVDEAVFALRDEYSLPGMKVLQFAFGKDLPQSVHIPHNHSANFVVYTGTHDNNTTKGWFRSADEATKKMLEEYAGKKVSEDEVNLVLAKMAYASVANIAILPMQDVLNLDEAARMNIPASVEDNWAWRMPAIPGWAEEDKLRHLVHLYNR